MKKLIILILLVFFCICCSSYHSIEKKCKSYPFPELDSLQRANQTQNYKIDIPYKWIESKFSQGKWFYIKDSFVDSLGYNSRKVDMYISQDVIVNKCIDYFTVDDYLNRYLFNKNLSLFPKKFNYVLLKTSHKIYGEIYIVKSRKRRENKIFSTSIFFLKYKNNAYQIRYTGLTENYNKYIEDVEKMIVSFRILD